jgi:RimJ/RimL family protein N-acetyltransferase
MKEVGGPIELSDREAEKWFSMMIDPGNDSDFYCLIFNKDDEPVGEVSFHRYDHKAKTAEFNIKIAGKHRSSGYSFEAIWLILRYYFYEFGGELMKDRVGVDNIVGQQVLEKFGFEHDPDVKNEEAYVLKMTKERFTKLYN